jgi:hypothetical protein
MRRMILAGRRPLAVAGATAGLMWFSTASSAQFRVEGDR